MVSFDQQFPVGGRTMMSIVGLIKMRELDIEKLADFHRRADEVRKVAEGIFDTGERAVVLQFVDDSETIAALALRRISNPSPRTP